MKRKRHHYVPAFYLTGFTAPDKRDRVWVYPKDGSTPFDTNVSNAAVEKYFYSLMHDPDNIDVDSVEKYLDQEIETPANPVIAKLRSHKRVRISALEKRKLTKYLAYMLTRVPANRIKVQDDIPRLVADAKKRTQDTFARKGGDSKYVRLTDALNALDTVKEELIQELSFPHFNKTLENLLYKMNWATFRAYPGLGFATSDNPFCYSEHLGLIDEESRFIFPLASDIVLVGAWAPIPVDDFAIYNVLFGKPEDNDVINRIVIASATKYIFYKENCIWMRSLIEQVRVAQA
ncbi:MAG: DUF4238 domain-containing protein [Chloroflexi bacterium]|nr:DUF4238 domain-containing protein [Chloroflexota bacterium]